MSQELAETIVCRLLDLGVNAETSEHDADPEYGDFRASWGVYVEDPALLDLLIGKMEVA